MGQVAKLDERRPTTKTVYLVAHVDTSCKPPVITGCAIYSEPAKSLTGAIGREAFAFDVIEGYGHDFESASRQIIEMPAPYRYAFEWALSMLLPTPPAKDGEP